MPTDGNLRRTFQTHLPDAHWTSVESFSTGQGIPDAEYCFPGGVTGWIEFKATSGQTIEVRPHQISWLERRSRAGGRIFIAVRRQVSAGPRKGAAVDELFLFQGAAARQLALAGLTRATPLGQWSGGPARWDWAQVKRLITQ